MKRKLLRRATQSATLVLIGLIPVLNTKGMTVLTGTLYSFAVGPVWVTDPLSGLQVIISAFAVDRVLLVSIGIPIVFTLVFGRVFCGWICPQNTLSELADFLTDKIKLKRFQPSPSPNIRYLIMMLLIILVPVLGFPVANLISAPGILSVQTSHLIFFGFVGIELSLVGVIVITEIFLVRRIWCKYICPQGAFLGLFRTGKTMKVLFREDEQHVCGRCFECAKACQFGLNPMGGEIYPLCHNCGDCITACEKVKQKEKPLAFKF